MRIILTGYFKILFNPKARRDNETLPNPRFMIKIRIPDSPDIPQTTARLIKMVEYEFQTG